MSVSAIGQYPSVGQFEGVSRQACRKDGGIIFRILLYAAYNAMGLIGSEYNGIAVCSDAPERSVLLDNHCQQQSGYFGPSQAQLAEFDRICAMSNEEFKEFVQTHYRRR